MKALILIALIAFTYCDDDDTLSPDIYSYKSESRQEQDYNGQYGTNYYPYIETESSSAKYVCPDDKIQLKDDVCAIVESSELEIEVENYGTCTYTDYSSGPTPQQGTYQCTKSKTKTKTEKYTINIKKKCGKNQKCVAYMDGNEDYGETGSKSSNNGLTNTDVRTNKTSEEIYKCQNRKLKLLKVDKKCAFGSECLTGYCKSGKCATLEACEKNENCGKGKFCYFDPNSKSSTGTCKSKRTSVGDCEVEDNCCAHGLQLSTVTGKYRCEKYFSLDLDADCDMAQICKSGICYNGKCAEFSKYDTTDTCSVVCKNKAGNDLAGFCLSGYYYNTDGGKVCMYNSKKSSVLEDMIDRYDKVKIDKLNDKEEDYDYYEALGDKKLAELMNVYENYEALYDLKLIKDDGKRNGDKKCEYEFWKSTISTSYVNTCIGLAFALLGLLL